MTRARLLIVCTGNSARSQIAEGLFRHEAGERFEVFSAGTEPAHVRPEAVQVMDEIAIDISKQTSKSVDVFSSQHFDLVITVCDKAREKCPVFPRPVQVLHWPFDDPASARRIRRKDQRIPSYPRSHSFPDHGVSRGNRAWSGTRERGPMNLLIIGGSDAGFAAALRARELSATARITLVLADEFPNYSICGLPFYVSGETPNWRDLAHTQSSVESRYCRAIRLRAFGRLRTLLMLMWSIRAV